MLAQLLIACILCLTVIQAYENGKEYSVRCKAENQCELVEGRVSNADSHAYGTYADEVDKDGWGKIWVHGDATVAGWYQSGFLEGALTSLRVYQHYTSWYSYQFGSSPLTPETSDFIMEQYNYANQLAQTKSNDPYYQTLNKLLAQFRGILDGVNYAAKSNDEKLTLLDLLLLEAAGDLYDIIPAVNPAQFQLHIGKLSAQDFFDRWHNQISCSALIKMKDDKSDIFAGHTSWTSYQNMLRIYKNYDMDGGLYQTSHSSKPGVIYSKDDFYVLPRNKLVVMETTNGVMNKELYHLVTTKSLLTWQRLPVVNALASTGQEWVDLVARYNSGTYANQWMVADMKLFTPGVGIANENFLWIIELAPGVAVKNDVTKVMLNQGGYWPSYNVPYDKSVYVITGFQEAYETYGDSYSYSNCTRAQIFARDQGSVQDFSKAQSILRYNDYLNDPLSAGNPTAAISARYDLRSDSPRTYGGVDSKVTSYNRVMKHTAANEGYASAESGPTHNNLKPFVWSTSGFDGQVHLGQPDVFNFDFVEMNYYQH